MTRPLSASSSPATILSSVDLPAPFGADQRAALARLEHQRRAVQHALAAVVFLNDVLDA